MNDRIYLDYAATTPVAPEVLEAMLPYFREHFGNASSLHSYGLEAKAALDRARAVVASALNVDPVEIIFTGGGTEANNLALLGTAFRYETPRHLITSAVEHPSIMETCRYLQKLGWQITYLPVNRGGWVQPESLQQAIRHETVLISIMYANNETGVINPIAELADIARDHNIPFHTDAVQAFGKIPIDLRELPIAMLSMAGHKIYGPKGVGVLFVRRGVKIQRILHGGGQEQQLRPGTENVPAIVGLARAVELCEQRREEESARLRELAERFLSQLQQAIPEAVVNGDPHRRLPWVINVSFPGLDNLSLVMGLNLQGIAVSNGSACSSGKVEPSHVLRAMELPSAVQKSAIRISLGRHTTAEELDRLLQVLVQLTRGRLKRPAQPAAS